MESNNMLFNLQTLFPQKVNMKRERRQISSVAFGLFAYSLIASIFYVLFLLIFSASNPELLNEGWFTIILQGVCMYFIALPLSLPYFKKASANPPKQRKISIAAWFGLLAIGYVLILVGNMIGITVNSIIESAINIPQQNAVESMTSGVPIWAAGLVIAVGAPIFEEIVYRKLVIDRLRRYGDLFAVVVSGLIFGLVHGNFSQFFYATLLGFLFALVYLYSGKLRYSIALHMAINFIGSVYNLKMSELMEKGNLLGTLMLCGYYVFIVACIVCCSAAYAKLRKYIRLKKPIVKVKAKQMLNLWLVNPAVWLLLFVLVYSFIANIAGV